MHMVDSWLIRRSVRADLVPVYHAGVSQMLTFWGAERLSRRLRMTVGVFWCGRPPRPAPLPRLSPVRMRGMHAPGAAPCPALDCGLLGQRRKCMSCWLATPAAAQGQVGPAAAAEAHHPDLRRQAGPRCAWRPKPYPRYAWRP